LAGRQVALLADAELGAGLHLLRWDGRLPAGISAGSGVY
jgi:hypothetical protein